MSKTNLPHQRWHLSPPDPATAEQLAEATYLSPLLTQVLLNRGIHTAEEAKIFLNPELDSLPPPLEEFPDLAIAIELLSEAIAQQHAIAICGDYDADGMTSTALLIRALRHLGGKVDYAIPSRMNEGYGINQRIVDDVHRDGVRLILTVDNGIAAYAPIAYARELGLTVIVTDHHDIPPDLPPAHAILNPKLIDEASPYRGLAGVGVAYLLALGLAETLNQHTDLETVLLELFTLGTIADLAPLTGVNRRWVQMGLKQLPQSQIEGVKALIQVSGLAGERDALKPEAIGFRLGPRINAVGRITDPEIVIKLLTTDNPGEAFEQAMKCEEINQVRRSWCDQIEQEAIAWIESEKPDLMSERVLVIVQPDWHHGVIGIVASRLVERYGVPVFIGTYEGSDRQHIRGSARSIPEFHVFNALQFCGDTLEKFGGHRAAGGFSLRTENLPILKLRLQIFANMYLQPKHLKPLVEVDVRANLNQLTLDLYEQIDRLHPCGIGNPDPVFWTPHVRVLEQSTIGRDRSHLKLMVAQASDERSENAPTASVSNNTTGQPEVAEPVALKAIAWRWGAYCPLPNRIDIAYRLRLNEWNGVRSVELELVGVQMPGHAEAQIDEASAPQAELDAESVSTVDLRITPPVGFRFGDRDYRCSICQHGEERELRIRNPEGKVLAVQPGLRRGLVGTSRDSAQEVDVFHPHYFNLICAAMEALRNLPSAVC